MIFLLHIIDAFCLYNCVLYIIGFNIGFVSTFWFIYEYRLADMWLAYTQKKNIEIKSYTNIYIYQSRCQKQLHINTFLNSIYGTLHIFVIFWMSSLLFLRWCSTKKKKNLLIYWFFMLLMFEEENRR